MKPIFFFLIICFHWIYSQDQGKLINQVENGLTLPVISNESLGPQTGEIHDQLKKYKIHGASVAIIDQGEIKWTRAYGFTDTAHKTPVTANTLFQCASIGKIITSLAALKLVEEGKIDLDDPVNDHLTKWKIPENEFTEQTPVTLRHLLSHSAGFQDEYGFLGYAPNDPIPDLLQIIKNEAPSNAKKPLVVKSLPGTEERYSGGGYLIIQLLIEELSGTGFDNYVTEKVLKPLDMNATIYEFKPAIQLIAQGHHSNGKALKNKLYHQYPEMAAAGPWTTATDLAKLILGIQGSLHGEKDTFFDPKLIKEMMSPQINRKGLGVNLRGLDAPEAFWHAGQNLGYTSLLAGLTNSGKGAVVLVNSDGGEQFIQEFISSVASAYDWPVMKSAKNREIATELQTKLMGKYQTENGDKTLYIENGKQGVKVRAEGSKRSHSLYQIGENHFTFKNSQDYYRLVFNYENDQIIGLYYTESIGNGAVLKKVLN